MIFETIDTERLSLRLVTPEVYQFVFENYNGKELIQFFGLQTDEQLALERNKYIKGMTTYRSTYVMFQVLLKETSEYIGTCSLHNWFPEHRRAELGYLLVHDIYKRKGYISEAITPILKYGFEQMNLNRIEAFVAPNNPASLGVMKKFNFTQEGYLKQHYCFQGTIEDSIVFALLQEEY